jgi:type II secretory pathway pseudopilin PulG
MNDNGKMSGNSYLTLEVLVALVIVGIVAIICVPQLAPTVTTIVLTALVGMLNNLTGVKSGGKMPEQAGDAKPGQSSQTTVATQTPAEPTK